MQIILTDAGKRYRFDWIFRGITHAFLPATATAVLGPNGSGKSTLLKALSGHLTLSKGKIVFQTPDGRTVDPGQVYRHISYAAPYIELIEEFTLEEALRFHTQVKPLRDGLTYAQFFDLLELSKSRAKEIRFFSSGMKQRLKLALAICSDTPILLLDEPTTNLDLKAIDWFHALYRTHASGRTVAIASNDPADLALCDKQISILDFK